MSNTVAKTGPKPSLLNVSVEEENLAALPFAVLERRVGKQLSKLEVSGRKVTADGTEVDVVWQLQGNSELGLPTEQDLDIFVALGVLTFRSNFQKTISFTGREIAKILNISGVHGKFYKRIKVAMDRFIPLRFRAVASTEQQEQVKWTNVFQEASFSLDRATGRCTGTITWTDKLIQSMDSGFFRLLDAGRYMKLDGITAKHLYRFLAVAFEKTDIVVIDARDLATQNLGILNPPKYFSRLMQTLEPAFEQLMRIGVLGSYHVVSHQDWRIALKRHAGYVPERKILLEAPGQNSSELNRACSQHALEHAGYPEKAVAGWCDGALTRAEFYRLQRAARLADTLRAEGVLPHVALAMVRQALDAGVGTIDGLAMLDLCEIALDVCGRKKRAGQALKNAGGWIVSCLKDVDFRRKSLHEQEEQALRQRFQQRETAALRLDEEAEERSLVIEYEGFRRQFAESILQETPEATRLFLRKEKLEILRQQDRLDRIAPGRREEELEEMMLQDIARREAPPFEKWRLRKRAQQALLPFTETTMEEAARL